MKSQQQQLPGVRIHELEGELAQKTLELQRKGRELEIESALERVRAVALGMKQPADMLNVCRVISQQLEILNIKEIRNVQTAVIYPLKGAYINYEYYRLHDKSLITEVTDHHPVQAAFINQMLNGAGSFFTTGFTGAGVKEWLEYQKTTNVFIDRHLAEAPSLNYYWHSLGPVALGMSTYAPLTNDALEVFKRFRNVFDLAYRRYLDVELALAQTREVQIQLALERVRARTMAMQKSEELQETSSLLFQQLKELGETAIQNSIAIVNEEAGFVELSTTIHGSHLLHRLNVPINDPYLMVKAVAAWKAKCKSLILEFEGEELKNYNNQRNSFLETKTSFPEDKWVVNISFFSKGWLSFSSNKEVPAEIVAVQQRFAAVFEQTFTRFKDLEQAEEQARESQIQLALERIRARTMAMQKSDELAETVFILFEQFNELGENPDQATIGIINEKEWVIEYWVTMYGSQNNHAYKFSIDEPNVTSKIYKAWKDQKKSLVIGLEGKSLKSFSEYRESKGGAAFNKAEKQRIINVAFFSKGLINVQSTAVRSEESIKLLERFAAVFEQTYTRFLDLQKAEEQAREAQIELGLERVRARAMAMQTSEELSDLVATVFAELSKLDMALNWCLITILDEASWSARVWRANSQQDQAPQSYYLPFAHHPFQNAIMQAWKERQEKWSYMLQGDEKKALDDYMFTETDYSKLPQQVQAGIRAAEPAYFYFSFGNFGGLQVGGPNQLTNESLDILARFGRVFDITYTRFNDLKKAEAQVREAQIQLALERVRARTMAMQHSEELAEAALLLFEQVQRLGLKTGSCGYNIWDKDKKATTVWVSSQGGSLQPPFKMPHAGNVTYRHIQAAMQKGDDFFTEEVGGKALKKHFDYLLTVPGIQDIIQKLIDDDFTFPRAMDFNTAFFAQGYLSFHTHEPCPEFYDIFTRFAKVFEQTYTRFKDLEQAEAQAREAKIEAALEKVRSRTMAMQRSEELAETAAVVFKQLIGLGIEPNRLFIGIINDDSGDIELWATEEDGSKLSTRFTGNIHGNGSINKMYEGWKQQHPSITIDMEGKELKDYFDYLTDVLHVPFKLGLSQKRRVQSVAYFSKGFIGMASPDEQPAETVKLLERFAGVFNLTFVRFHDLQVAEAHATQAELDLILLQTEKKRAEDALIELRATQTQLVQKEKMASLGELTAGIAHEIQNPLNFVNNFSEVNREMLEELKAESIKPKAERDEQLEIDLITDIIKNEEKINHHGKRADAIVKGMLEHSRASTGEKTATNINALADEYFKLSYHGLLVKDKNFNATMLTRFDEQLPLISVIGRDIGRVLINLFNNAFYAVNQKAKAAGGDYKPTVEVETSMADGKVVINVKDNGAGMPEHIKDKIMQPFFTTKPTGEGTGLGLSLTYDMVVKGHGGTIQVNSVEGEGSEFVITLPVG